MAWGLFKKVIIADKLALVVDVIYNDLHNFSGLHLIMATVLFAFQIYCDFSGYSDIAIGSARIMGFDIMNNFNRPYHSKSVAEFWRRWHISLSTWFRDYLYIPLGGNRVRSSRHYLNLMLTFTISGLWHGASWTFVIWGAIHGFYLVVSIITKNIREKIAEISGFSKLTKLRKVSQVIIVFLLVDFAWIFFRAKTLDDAMYVICHLFTGISSQINDILHLKFKLGMRSENFIVMISALIIMEIVHILQSKTDIDKIFSEKPLYLRFAVYYLFIISLIFFGEFGTSAFIYFQF